MASARGPLRHRSLRRTAAAGARMPGTEPILASSGLPNGELRDRARRRLLPLGARQRRANQPAMDGTVFVVALAVVVGLSVDVRVVDPSGVAWRRSVLLHGRRGLLGCVGGFG